MLAEEKKYLTKKKSCQCCFLTGGKLIDCKTENKKRFTSEKDLVSKKFTLGTANVHLGRFSKTHKRHTAKCKKLTKSNVQKEWSTWKAVLQAVGPWKWVDQKRNNPQIFFRCLVKEILSPLPQTTKIRSLMKFNIRLYSFNQITSGCYMFVSCHLFRFKAQNKKVIMGETRRMCVPVWICSPSAPRIFCRNVDDDRW